MPYHTIVRGLGKTFGNTQPSIISLERYPCRQLAFSAALAQNGRWPTPGTVWDGNLGSDRRVAERCPN